jgi:hypothetical protein
MGNERYSIEVSDNSIIIYGDLSIEETFDFLNFFDRKGFKSITNGDDNSALYMRRKSIEEAGREIQQQEHIESELFFQNLYDDLRQINKKLESDIINLENLIKDLMTDEKKKQYALLKENEFLIRSLSLSQLSKNPEAIKIVENLYPEKQSND